MMSNSKEIVDNTSIAVRETQRRLCREQILTTEFFRNQQVINEMIQKDCAYRFLKNVRGSPAYFQSEACIHLYIGIHIKLYECL